MRRRSSRPELLAGVALLLAGAAPASAGPRSAHRFHADDVLGTSLEVTVVTGDEALARRAAEAARAEIVRLESVLSSWRDDAELARTNAGVARARSPELLEAVALAEGWRDRTGGAFDARLGALTQARRAGRRAGSVAAPPSSAPALDPDGRPPEGAALDLDGLAKGLIVDRALMAARRASPGADGVLVEIGGDLRADGVGPDGRAWRVGVAPGGSEEPELTLNLPAGGSAVASSGAGERDILSVEGGRSHILDSSGAPVPLAVRATVTAPCAADADALATALCVMPPAAGLALAESLPGVEAQVHDAHGRAHATSGWSTMVSPVAPRLHPVATAAWPADQALTVTYEVPRIAAPKYYAPYVVIWITDLERNLVKTVALLGEKPRYFESNYVWWRRYGRRTPGVDALAKPTRAPGRYTAAWNGSTDAGGQVGPGRYIVHVEAARQDGGHTYETLEITVPASGGAVASAPPKDELGTLRVSVGPASRRT